MNDDRASSALPVTGVILAGGQGRRMGGINKGLLPLGGRPMIESVLERLRPQVEEIIISANRDLEIYRAFGQPVFSDAVGEFAGPLAGLYTALVHARYPLVAAVPCDSPFLPGDLVMRLYQALQDHNAEIAVVSAGGRLHPVFCLCRREIASELKSFIASGGRRFMQWHAARKGIEVAFDDQQEAFRNLNTRDEIDKLNG